jgi:hypothetical protein
MIIWLASYPRSGNTFLRIVLHRLYGTPTYSIYQDDDPVAQRVGPSLVGYRPKPVDRAAMAECAEVFFVKTHKRRKLDGHPAIYLVRDGRDAVVSHARLRHALQQEEPQQLGTLGTSSTPDPPVPFEQFLRNEITRPYVEGQPSSGTWGGNVLSWLKADGPPTTIIKYEDLIVDPVSACYRAVSSLPTDLVADKNACIPSFSDLHHIDPIFFRKGAMQSYRQEMSQYLQNLFGAQPENALAMHELGYLYQ